MAYAITQTCCNDATCVSVCPVNCIHPTPDEPDFGTTEMLYIDPRTCIDCGACADACPVDAVFPVDLLSADQAVFSDINAQYYEDNGADHTWGAPRFPRSGPQGSDELRIAVVGTGPAAAYTAQSLLRSTSAEITMIDRLPVPGGLVRYGVAPDHPSTKKIGDSFAALYRHPRLRAHMNLEVGADVSHAEVAEHHHAVVYAVGASRERTLDVSGEDGPASISATRFVGWYNAHPDVPPDAVDLSAERVVLVGNGNVALDVARILLSDPEELATTDIAEHALRTLRRSRVREVVLLGRRGPRDAAYTRPEFRALSRNPDLRIVVDDQPGVREAIDAAAPGDKAALLDGVPIESCEQRCADKRLVLRFWSAPVEIASDGSVLVARTVQRERVQLTSEQDWISAGLVVRSIGYRSAPLADLPFDEATATVPHRGGRVVDPVTEQPVSGAYVVGWIKRGPSGGIGTNRTCSQETVDSVLDDAVAGRLPVPSGSRRAFTRLVRRRKPSAHKFT
ncbi:4Fe-4S dicluster domain-containing protein [Allosaccharopolyspora coralli]|uniref:ferredoxin--NADP(+) reductase n=1 Tax=Allosaccharopolyspora coralli TaxID=2665642 RepID=A0A5Q3QHQ4_9PSEU|nr:FAD-dependent oxidoreductase [Allosaccharopolyspora coralli]QGK70989.1 4Fe-4S dicluster domain-containing protein [Allosaccharopolyspora coralli]